MSGPAHQVEAKIRCTQMSGRFSDAPPVDVAAGATDGEDDVEGELAALKEERDGWRAQLKSMINPHFGSCFRCPLSSRDSKADAPSLAVMLPTG